MKKFIFGIVVGGIVGSMITFGELMRNPAIQKVTQNELREKLIHKLEETLYGKPVPQKLKDTRYDKLRYKRPVPSELVLVSGAEALQVLDRMREILASYSAITLGDFYDLVGIDSTYVDFHKGWRSLDDVHIVPVTDGYTIVLPEPEELKD